MNAPDCPDCRRGFAAGWRPRALVGNLLPCPPIGEVHLWAIRLAPAACTCPLSMLALLPPPTRLRLERLRDPGLRAQRCMLHAQVCMLLAAYLGIEACAVPLERGLRGKPRLQPNANPQALSYNLSHSRDLALLALGRECTLGVDIEYQEPGRDTAALARRYYHSDEIKAMEALPRQEQIAAFYQCWSRKEAYLKAVGVGLDQALRTLRLGWRESPMTFAPTGDQNITWNMYNLDLAPDYAAALCTRRPLHRIQRFVLADPHQPPTGSG